MASQASTEKVAETRMDIEQNSFQPTTLKSGRANFGSEGCGFESLRARQCFQRLKPQFTFAESALVATLVATGARAASILIAVSLFVSSNK